MQLLIAFGAVFAVLSLITTGSGVKPRHELKPIWTASSGAALGCGFRGMLRCALLWRDVGGGAS